MRRIFTHRLFSLLCLLGFTESLCAAVPGDGTEPYTPKVSESSNEGRQAIQGFRIPEFLKVEIVAAEPDLANPVAFCVDERGRFYIAETFRQKKGVEDNRSHMDWLHDDLAAQTVEDRLKFFRKHLGDQVGEYAREHDRIRLLEDTDGDGQVDKSTVFADGFNAIEDGTGAGVLAVDGNVYYTCIPKLYRLKDTDGDGIANTRETLHDGYGVRVAFRGHDMHGLTLGPDGRIYFSIGDRGYNVLTQEGVRLKRPDTGAVFRCEPDGSHLEVFAHGLRNPQELAFDDFGNLFTGDNNSDSGDQARWVYVVEGGDTGWRMYYQYLPDRGPWNRERMWYPHQADKETALGQPAYIIPPIANLGDGPSGLTYYPGVGLPQRYDNHFFMADFRGSSPNSGIRSFSVKPKGASFELTDSHEFLWSILATDVDFGYDGHLYLTDWVNGWDGSGKGRLYRFSSEEDTAIRSEVTSMFARGFDQLTNEELLEALGHRDRRVRQRAQFTIVKRIQKQQSSLELFGKALQTDQPRMARIHAVWGIGQHLRTGAEFKPLYSIFESLLKDADQEVRAQVARVLGDVHDGGAWWLLRSMVAHDKSPRVQHLASISLGRIYHFGDQAGDTAATDAERLFQILRETGDDDPVLRHSAVMGLVGIGRLDPQWLIASLNDAQSEAERLGVLLAMRKLNSPRIKRFLNDSNPDLVLEAARAIHDESMEEQTSELADLINKQEFYSIDPLMRRVVHAAYRVGGQKYASAVAEVATHDSVSEEVRVFAAELLSEWNSPGPLDRVTGSWRPLARGETPGMKELLSPQLAALLSSGAKLRALGIQLASLYQIQGVEPILWSIFENEEEQIASRVSSLEALAALGDEKIESALKVAIESDSPRLRASARNIMLARDPEAAIPQLGQAIEQGTPIERQFAINALAGIKNPPSNEILYRLTGQLVEKSLPPDIQLDVLRAARVRSQERFKRLVKQYEQQVAESENPFEKYQVSLEGGDLQRGYEIFFGRSDASCRRCHKVNGSGGEVGPDLSKIGLDKQRDYLLEAIVNPNARIAKGFETAILVLDTGKVITGIVKEENPQFIKVMLNDGTLVQVDQDEIEDRAPGRSGMPEDLVKQLSLSDIRDLVEYLSSLRGGAASEGHSE